MILHDRQLICLRLTAEGYSTQEIAARLHVSDRTIKNDLYSARDTLEARNVTHAVVLAMANGLITTTANQPVSVRVALARVAGALGYQVQATPTDARSVR